MLNSWSDKLYATGTTFSLLLALNFCHILILINLHGSLVQISRAWYMPFISIKVPIPYYHIQQFHFAVISTSRQQLDFFYFMEKVLFFS
jgi:hypothetical protein